MENEDTIDMSLEDVTAAALVVLMHQIKVKEFRFNMGEWAMKILGERLPGNLEVEMDETGNVSIKLVNETEVTQA